MDVEISPLITDKETKTQRGSRICSKAGHDSWQNQSSHLTANSVVVERALALEPGGLVWNYCSATSGCTILEIFNHFVLQLPHLKNGGSNTNQLTR